MARALSICAILSCAVLGWSQDLSRPKVSVTLEPPEATSVERGRPGTVELQFRVAPGFHINSNQPKQEYLKKTELELAPPKDIVIGKIAYPEGHDLSFPFAPDEKLNVYSGDFAIHIVVRPLKSVTPMNYAVNGVLKYQACDNAECFPPKQLPVTFEVKVTKDRSQSRAPVESSRGHS